MLLKYFYDEHLAQASYLVGCVKTGEALVVDPSREIAPYLEAADKAGLRITHVTETHIHADFVSGSRELAAATGATIYLSAMGGAEWQYAYADDPNVTLVRDGDAWRVGNVRIEAMHTPGHTPEHLTFLVTDMVASGGAADRYIGAFTGDFLFVGDVGRPRASGVFANCPTISRFGRDMARAVRVSSRLARCLRPRSAMKSCSIPRFDMRTKPNSWRGCSTGSRKRRATLPR